MSQAIIELNCPGWGARVSTSQKTCDWCHNPIIVSTFNTISAKSPLEINKMAGAYRKALAENPDNKDLNTSIAMCYLKLKMYDNAIAAFAKAVEDNFDNSETFFYGAIAMMKGKKPFLLMRPEIDKIEEYINAALMIEPRGIYYYLLAYIKYDYYSRKFFKTSPTYQEALSFANQAGYSEYDVQQLFALLGTEKPTQLN